MKPPSDKPSGIEQPGTQGMSPGEAEANRRPEPTPSEKTSAIFQIPGEHHPGSTVASTRAYDPSNFDQAGHPHVLVPTEPAPPSSGAGLSTGSGGGSRRGVVGKIAPGQTLYGKYQVLKRLGGGAMGDVWLVRHVSLKAERALKVIVPNFAANEIALMRFQREFEIMASLRHEHAVSIYDAALDEDGGYIEMEYVEGQTLFETIVEARARPALDPTSPFVPLEWLDRVLEQLCEVLHVAHEKNIVHRDLKPANLMLMGGRKPGKEYLKVLDFGIAKIRDDPDNRVNQGQESGELKTMGFIGTPSYGSPEQAMSLATIDGRADIYSVGVMLYEFVAGRLPFRGNQWQMMHQHATAAAPPFVEVNPRLRPMPEVEYAILRALAKDPAHRPQTARELYEDVHRAIVDLPIGPPTGPPIRVEQPPVERPPSTEFGPAGTSLPGWSKDQPDTLVAEPKPPPEETFTPPAAPPGRRRFLVLAGSVAAAAVALPSGYFALNRGKTPVTPIPPDRERWNDYLPDGYAPPAGYEVADGPWPPRIIREQDTATFELLADSKGIYLPEGYKPENAASKARDGWPTVLVREGDKSRARYLRIVGGQGWPMGDWGVVGLDKGNNATPVHQVELSGYYIQETETTNAQFEDFLRKRDRETPTEWRAALDRARQADPERYQLHPAVAVSRKDAESYAAFARGRLPTEAQWEYAARSRGQQRRYVWGEDDPGQKHANVCRSDGARTAPVGSYPDDRTEQGVLDLGGNASEWCRDGMQAYQQSKKKVEVDPCGVPNPDRPEYVVRGGNSLSLPGECPTTYRDTRGDETEPTETLGFRIVIECPDARTRRSQ